MTSNLLLKHTTLIDCLQYFYRRHMNGLHIFNLANVSTWNKQQLKCPWKIKTWCTNILLEIDLTIRLLCIIYHSMHKVDITLMKYVVRNWLQLTFSRQISVSYTNQFNDLLYKSTDWFLYVRSLCHERVNYNQIRWATSLGERRWVNG